MASKNKVSVGARLLGFVCFAIIAGLLVAGLVVPLTAIVASVSNAAMQDITTLPLDLETPEVPEESRILASDGTLIGTVADQNRTWVSFDEIAPIMRDAIVAIEDHRFYKHGALDFDGFVRAVLVNLLGGDIQGASSITQQYVKLVRGQAALDTGDKDAYDEATATTMDRKISELRYAVGIERVKSKEEILEGYLNLAYFGDGAYGVEAAAAHYFGVHASELTLAQAAMLAGLVQNPATTDPINYEGAAITRRNVVLNRMAHPDVAMITEAEAAAAKAESFDQSKVTSFNSGCAFAAYPFVCQYIEQVFASEQMAMFGATPEARLNFLHRGGLTIHTTIDPKAMDAAITAVMERAAPSDPVIAVSATVEAGTGRILQMSQSRPVMGSNVEAGETFYNYAVENWMGGAGGFQAGSTFKTYTLATALSQGASLGHYYDAPKNMDFSKDAFQSCDGAVYTPWTVRNFGDSEYGQITLLNATIDSVNTYFAQLIRDVGVCQTVNMAKYTGLHAARVHPETGGSDLIDDYHYDSIPSFTLGSAEVAPLNMAESYATFAARGVHCDPIIIDALEDRDGNSRAVPDANCQQVIDPAVADGVSQILNQVIYGSGASEGRVAGSWPQAAKTGTTDDAYAYWIMGFTRNYATAVAVAADNGSTYWDAVRGGDKSITGLLLPSGRRIPYSSGSTAGPILRAVMTQALTEQPVIPFEHYNPIRGSFNNRLTPTPTEEPEPPTLTVSYITPSVTTTITTTSKPPPTTIMPTTTTTIPPTTTITIPPTTTSTSSAPATSATTEVP